MSYEQALAAIRADLDRIPDASRWCYHNGYWPLKPNHDRPTALHDPTMPADWVPGATYDHGFGAYQCRAGWVTARGHLASADQQTASILGHLAPWARSSPLSIRDDDRHESDVPKYADAVRRRVTAIQLLRGTVGPDMREWVADTLTSRYGPVWRAAEAYAELTTHHHRTGDQVASHVTVPMCKICSLRAAEPKRVGKCARCEQRILRDDRPRRTVMAEIREESAAELAAVKARRAAQGCGYGAA